MSSHQNLSVRLISILSFSWLPSFTYLFCQYQLWEMKICFIVSARCTNMVTMDDFPKLARFPGLSRYFLFSESNCFIDLQLQNVIDLECKTYNSNYF